MKRHLRSSITCLVVALLCLHRLSAQETLVYPSPTSLIEIGPFCQTFVDKEGKLGFEQIKHLPEGQFHQTKNGSLSFGSTTASIWIKFLVKNQTAEPLYLNFTSFSMAFVDLFVENENGELGVRESGMERAGLNRDLERGNIALNIGSSPKVVFINIKSRWPISAQATLSALKPLADSHYSLDTFNGICMGILIAMALYNMFLFCSVRDRLYLYYFAYICMALWLVSSMNMTYKHFINWGKGFAIRELLVISGIVFSMRFLNTRKLAPRGHKALIGFIVILFASMIMNMLEWQPYANLFFQLTTPVCLIMLPALGIMVYRQGHKSALYYSIAWITLVLCGLVTLLSNLGIGFSEQVGTRSVMIGTCVETILLAFALAYRLKEYRDASESAQQLAIQRLEENERLTKEQNKVLEEKVHERTTTLQESLETLKAAQTQLIQSEKLASLGELTAGIAHEIQNPLNFVNNFSELSVDLAEELKTEIGKLAIPDGDKEYVAEILTDLASNQQKINHHGKRASGIVTGMLQHARTSTGTKEPTDLNALADEYLRLSYHGLRAKDSSFNATMVTDFDPALGKIDAIPQDMGRVLLNLMNNAFYATQQRQALGVSGYEPTVSISTKRTASGVEIRIKDNGTGIPEHVKTRIFQPFFTTKPTGQGTGLGLSISYDIVVKGHGGSMVVESTDGEGTEFIIQLPT